MKKIISFLTNLFDNSGMTMICKKELGFKTKKVK